MKLKEGMRVELSDAGRSQFPNLIGRGGDFDGYSRTGEARVVFDGRGTIVRLDPSFLKPSAKNHDARTDRFRGSARYYETLEKRKLVRRAFDLIRHDPAQKELVTTLAQALGGVRGKITPKILQMSRAIVGE